MQCTEPHNVYFFQEILLIIKPFQFKSGNKERGASWKMVSEDLNTITELSFSTTQKSVRDRYCLLIEKHKNNAMKLIHQSLFLKKKKLDILLQNIVEETKVFLQQHQSESNRKQKQMTEDGQLAEETDNLALEGLLESKKRVLITNLPHYPSKTRGVRLCAICFMRKRNRN